MRFDADGGDLLVVVSIRRERKRKKEEEIEEIKFRDKEIANRSNHKINLIRKSVMF
jgi:hypothetical protein